MIFMMFEDSRFQLEQLDGYIASYSPPPQYVGTFHNLTSPAASSGGNRISPAVLFIIVILAVLFFISGVLHLLVRYLIKRHPSSSTGPENGDSRYPEMSESDALQRQLQQLFHLHDSGLDQAFIDALPVFHYKEIVGLKESVDCAVCLCEFTDKDKLRLLPVCSHAFHISCIDTWLLSNSTCPLCRGTLFAPGFSMENPMFDFDEFGDDDNECSGNGEIRLPIRRKTVEVKEIVQEKGTKVFPVRLGKFRKVTEGEGAEEKDVGETSSSNLDARRCFSMGSYQYVVADTSLRVPLSQNMGAGETKLARRIENNMNRTVVGDLDGKKISSVAKADSFSISKIWLWPKKGIPTNTTDAEMGNSSSLNSDFSWMRKSTQGP